MCRGKKYSWLQPHLTPFSWLEFIDEKIKYLNLELGCAMYCSKVLRSSCPKCEGDYFRTFELEIYSNSKNPLGVSTFGLVINFQLSMLRISIDDDVLLLFFCGWGTTDIFAQESKRDSLLFPNYCQERRGEKFFFALISAFHLEAKRHVAASSRTLH